MVMAQVPLRTPRTCVPTNVQYLVPFTMVMRMVPADFFGIAMFTALTSFAALTFPPRFTTNLVTCSDVTAFAVANP